MKILVGAIAVLIRNAFMCLINAMNLMFTYRYNGKTRKMQLNF